MSGEGRSSLFVRSSSEEDGLRSRTTSLSSVREDPIGEASNDVEQSTSYSYSSLSIPSKSKDKSGKFSMTLTLN